MRLTICRPAIGCILAAVASAVLLSPQPALSAPQFSGSVTGVAGVQNSPSPVDLVGPDGSVHVGSFISGRTEALGPARGLNNGLGHNSSANASATFDDILIQGPAGGLVPFTMHIPFHASITQNWTAITYSNNFTDISDPRNAATFSAQLFSPGGNISGRLILRTLGNAVDVVDLATEQTANVSVVATGQYPPPETLSNNGVTLFKNVPLDTSGFLNMTRSQIPVTNASQLFGPGAGLARADLVELRGEIQLTGAAQVGVPVTLNLVMSADASAVGSTDQSALAILDARSTFGPPLDGSLVFDLPDGYTAQSASLNIINNVVVPEPGAVSLLCIIAALGLSRRRGA